MADTPPPVFHIYILRCADGTYYVGHTTDLSARLARHTSARGASCTDQHHATALVWYEPHPTRADAMRRERQIKGWSRAKKEALIAGKLGVLKQLSKCRTAHLSART